MVILCLLSCTASIAQGTHEGTETVTYRGVDGCIKLFNGTTIVILDPTVGGRVVEYSVNGKNTLYHNPEKMAEGVRGYRPDAGRFDIGPEMTAPSRGPLWNGAYQAEITGPRSARLTSVKDVESTGVQIVREFVLDKVSSHVRCTQTIVNISNETKRYNHWSRTLAIGGGICIVPLTPELSRFPLGYIYYGPGGVLNYRHEDHPNIRVRDNYLEIIGTPPEPKFGIDSHAGWLGYITVNDLLFVKKFPTYPDRRYGEVAAYTISLWYYENQVCELEPIGPTEVIEAGGSASFTEDWWLFPFELPPDRTVDLQSFEQFVDANAK